MAFDVQMLTRGLIGGKGIQQFNREIRERRATKFEAAIDPEQLNQLYSLDRLESLFNDDALPILYVDIFDDGHLKKLADVQRKSGKSCLAAAIENFRRGSTIRVRDLDKFDTRLNRLVSEIQRYFTARSQINLYLTPPAKTGFPPHFDITDAFIIQCIGSKEWRLFPDYSNRIELPLMATNWDPDRFRPSEPSEGITLGPGDVLYLPRGAMHQAFCTERESMHLTVSLVPLTFADLIAKALNAAAEEDVELRRRAPWSVEDGKFDELTGQVRERIVKLVDRMDVGSLLAAERCSLSGDSEANSSGELQSVIASLIRRAAG
jgi:hypothetical protein